MIKYTNAGVLYSLCTIQRRNGIYITPMLKDI